MATERSENSSRLKRRIHKTKEGPNRVDGRTEVDFGDNATEDYYAKVIVGKSLQSVDRKNDG